MKPSVLPVVGVLAVAMAAAFVVLGLPAPQIALRDARLVPVGGGHALVLTIDNRGGPDRLIGVSAGDGQLTMAGVGADAGLPVPAGSSPALAMDGAHGMVTGLTDVAEGQLVPVTVRFAHAGAISARARVAGGSGMAHSAAYDVPPDAPSPEVSIAVEPAGERWLVRLDTENFVFARDAVDGPHVTGTGHAHLYVGGLKLGRVYDAEVEVGALPPGTHEFRVSLNTNDHRVYAVDGAPVTAAVRVDAGGVAPH